MDRRNFLLIGGVGAAVIAGGGYLVNDMMRPFGLDADDAVTDHIIGSQTADVRMIAYVSYTCSHCASFHRAVWPALKREYIDTRKIRFSTREVMFNRYDMWASLLARETGRRGFYGFVDELLERQTQWVSDDAEQTFANLRYMGMRHGLAEARIDHLLGEGGVADAENLVGWIKRNTDRDRVTSTPTLIIDGRKYGNMHWSELKSHLDSALA